MSDNPIKTDARHARRRRILPPEADTRCLVETETGIQCYACYTQSNRYVHTEQHHPAGQHNLAVTVPVTANDHRILSDSQQDWPTGTLQNSDGSPLLRAAAAIRGWLDILQLVIERTVGWIPPVLEALDAWLREQLCDTWWNGFVTATPCVRLPPIGGGR